MRSYFAIAAAIAACAAAPALAESACEACAKKVQIEYAKCLQNGGSQVDCNKKMQAAAKACMETCKK